MNEYADLLRDVQKLKTDVYYGEGKDNPSITGRLLVIEECVERIDKNLNKITYSIVTLLLMVIGDIVVQILKKGF